MIQCEMPTQYPTIVISPEKEKENIVENQLKEMLLLYAEYGVKAAESAAVLKEENASNITIEIARNDTKFYLAKMEAIRECIDILDRDQSKVRHR